ncbi:MAG TPA: GNAT family N-acetyltransferase [Pseudolysinimonas sp.]|jgi:phosphinothricin acetyltransferase|nr:GNAT family N-acetyltransferase [Pseudolysinimonas sp.]
MLPVTIRAMRPGDWPQVERIYREGIATGDATFEPEPPTWQSFDSGKVREPRLVAADEDQVIGWAAASPVSSRPVYRGVIEHSVYVAEAAQGRGVGGRLLAAFLDAAEAAGYWTVQSSIFPENVASIALHEKHGFRAVGRREAIALMTYGPQRGRWRDTVLVEWRSREVGR